MGAAVALCKLVYTMSQAWVRETDECQQTFVELADLRSGGGEEAKMAQAITATSAENEKKFINISSLNSDDFDMAMKGNDADVEGALWLAVRCLAGFARRRSLLGRSSASPLTGANRRTVKLELAEKRSELSSHWAARRRRRRSERPT